MGGSTSGTDHWMSGGANEMKPVPETAAVLRDLAEHRQPGLEATLMALAHRAQSVVPECVGLSLGLIQGATTFTLVATDETIAGLDAVQYADWGPCVEAAERHEPVEVSVETLLDERRWQLFAQASAAAGVRSTLSMPIMDGDRMIGGVNLYASTPHAFHDRHQELADGLGTSAEGAVRNADLSFSTRQLAADSAERYHASGDIELAVGILVARHRLDPQAARARLREAAARAGISEAEAARAIKPGQPDP